MKLPSLKTATKTASWIPIATAVATLILKQFGFPVSEDFITQILSLFGVGGVGLVASTFIPPVPTPTISGYEKVAYDAWFVLDCELADDMQARSALDQLDERMKLRYRSARATATTAALAPQKEDSRINTVLQALTKIDQSLNKPADVKSQA